MSVFEREQQVLAASAPPDTSALIPSTLEDVELLDPDGDTVTLSGAIAGKPAVLVLYRGAWCPFCNLALHTYEHDLVPALAKRGIGLIAISPQHPDGSLSMMEKQQLTYAVLSDPGNQIASQLGVLTAPSPEARATQLELGLDLEDVNADGTTTLPMPTVAIVGGARTLRWIDVHPDYSSRTTTAQILDALDHGEAP